MNCKPVRTRVLKAMAERKLDEYDKEMIDRLIQIVKDELDGMSVEEVDEDFWVGLLESWDVADPDEWAFDEVQSSYEDACEAKYDAMKDEGLL